ncbi:S9 family peptidase [Thalassotalea sp. PP2-459]|uniref:alpha/beta hydrolase family protein n=1 Tax=Thalassotalea sp. PP2-459 TaxID=1742724 RepID=UPI001587FE9F|nr:alpha/beta fold hydrolase [Thalassotalea sp. PP2-459]
MSAIAQAKNVNSESISVEKEISIKNNSLIIAGTLLIPDELNSDSLVILLTGSGPQDRNETLDGFSVFKEISVNLQLGGVASFRFDDRGVGSSTGNFNASTLDDHVSDVKKIIEFFKHHNDYNFKKFILLGHSQGGIVAAKTAVNNNDIQKIVLMGAPSVPLVDIVLYQIRQEYMAKEVAVSAVEALVSAHNELMWSISMNKKVALKTKKFNEATKQILKLTNKNITSEALNKQVNDSYKEYEIIYSLPSLTSFLYHDSATDYEKLDIPVLAFFGGKDYQVSIEQNKDIMEKALLKSETNFHFVTFDNANHYFQKAETGLRNEYIKLDKAFVNGFMKELISWITLKQHF